MGADHNLVDDKNNTVLHYASRNLEYALKSTLGRYHPRLTLCHQLTHASVRLCCVACGVAGCVVLDRSRRHPMLARRRCTDDRSVYPAGGYPPVRIVAV